MGMDVFGLEPISETGKYFRRNMAGWGELAELVTTLCPIESHACEYWYSNDGFGLDAAKALALADALEAKIHEGAVLTYLKMRGPELTNESCWLCDGSGHGRCDESRMYGVDCDLTDNYAVGEENVRNFIAFLLDSGGFEIL